MALSQSLPTPMTQELFPLVVNEAEGAPVPLPEPVAPIAPDPSAPVELTPEKLMTVMEDCAGKARVAVTETFARGDEAKARQISEVPRWRFARTTKTQFKPPPTTAVTELLVPEEDWTSVDTKARSNSFGAVVEKIGLVSVLIAEPWSRQTNASVA